MCEVIHSALFTIFIYIDKLSEKVETDAWYFRSQGKLYKGCGGCGVKVILGIIRYFYLFIQLIPPGNGHFSRQIQPQGNAASLGIFY